MRLHLEHLKRRISSFSTFPSLSITLRSRHPRKVNGSPHIGQQLVPFALTKCNTALLDKTVA